MNALWLQNRRLCFRDDVDLPPRAAKEARVRVLTAGICATDLALLDGLYPFEGVPGHEFVGLRKHCRRRTALGIRGRNGAFAEYLQLPADNLHVVPDNVATDAAVLTEPLAAALDIVERCAPDSGEPVLVVGVGRLGQLVCRALAASGVRVVAAGRTTDKLARLEGVAEETLLADAIEPRSFAMAVECTGHPAGLPIALHALRPRGTLVLKSTYQQPLKLDMAPLVVDELHLMGSRCGPFREALRLLEDRRVDVESLIDARFSLADGVEAFAHSRRPGIIKVVLDVGRCE
jgi:2-desacetyl-2-hydroxyethyl bacteriochlorophyllide A dehydrogenase